MRSSKIWVIIEGCHVVNYADRSHAQRAARVLYWCHQGDAAWHRGGPTDQAKMETKTPAKEPAKMF